MPEGHSIHRLARRHRRLLGEQVVGASSPQGRFAEGAARLDGARLAATDAVGKHLLHRYEHDVRGEELWLHVHLGLYGKFRDGTAPAPEPRGALRLRLVAGERWLDLRGPTACHLVSTEERRALLARLGPDPLRRDADPDAAWRRISRSRAPLGTLLLDQSVVAGIGNIYRAELLFRHGLAPQRPGRDVAAAEWTAMWADLVTLMRAGARSGRIVTTEPDDRARPAGRARRVDAHYVYGRAGLPCRRCGTPVAHGVLAARTLFWCPTCQPG